LDLGDVGGELRTAVTEDKSIEKAFLLVVSKVTLSSEDLVIEVDGLSVLSEAPVLVVVVVVAVVVVVVAVVVVVVAVVVVVIISAEFVAAVVIAVVVSIAIVVLISGKFVASVAFAVAIAAELVDVTAVEVAVEGGSPAVAVTVAVFRVIL